MMVVRVLQGFSGGVRVSQGCVRVCIRGEIHRFPVIATDCLCKDTKDECDMDMEGVGPNMDTKGVGSNTDMEGVGSNMDMEGVGSNMDT